MPAGRAALQVLGSYTLHERGFSAHDDRHLCEQALDLSEDSSKDVMLVAEIVSRLRLCGVVALKNLFQTRFLQ